jgi:hypothetical protein
MSFANKIKDSMWYWLGKKNPFVINDEYKLELLFIDKVNNSAKIKITNLKNNREETVAVECLEGTHDGR